MNQEAVSLTQALFLSLRQCNEEIEKHAEDMRGYVRALGESGCNDLLGRAVAIGSAAPPPGLSADEWRVVHALGVFGIQRVSLEFLEIEGDRLRNLAKESP